MDSPDQIKKQKSNSKSHQEDNKCFQYVVKATLNHQKIKKP